MPRPGERPISTIRRSTELVDGARGSCLEITDHEVLIDSLKLPDPDDRHVLAAAIKAKAQVIVTAILRSFPAEALPPWALRGASTKHIPSPEKREPPRPTTAPQVPGPRPALSGKCKEARSAPSADTRLLPPSG